MSVSQLLSDLARLGVRIEARDDVLRYSPQSAVTPELASRMKAHKADLLSMLRSAAELGACEDCGQPLVELPTFDGFLNLECPGCHRCFGCRPSTAEVAARFDKASSRASTVFDDDSKLIGEVVPCRECGSLELWQSLAGNWRCQQCDPPTEARRLRKQAAELRGGKDLGPPSELRPLIGCGFPPKPSMVPPESVRGRPYWIKPADSDNAE